MIESLLTFYLENCQALYTPKSANSILLLSHILCSVGGRRLHVIYVYLPFNIFVLFYIIVSIHICFRYCGKKTISVIVDYTIKAWQLNSITVIYLVDIKLLDESEIKNRLCIRFLVPISEACTTSFHYFLETFIRKVLITNFVLSSINAFELMMFQNKMDQLDLPKQQQTALDIYRDFMFLKGITVIEHDYLFFSDPFIRGTWSGNVPIQEERQKNCLQRGFYRDIKIQVPNVCFYHSVL